jgi:Rrf2 family protein
LDLIIQYSKSTRRTGADPLRRATGRPGRVYGYTEDVLWSQTTEYALRAVVCMAAEPDALLTTAQIAAATQVPAGYLSKVLQTLARAQIVRAQRGLGGGFTLGRAAAEISVLDVVRAVDPIGRIRQCPLGVAGHGRQLCALHRRMDDALAAVERTFAAARVADLLDQGRGGALCTPSASAVDKHPHRRPRPRRARP